MCRCVKVPENDRFYALELPENSEPIFLANLFVIHSLTSNAGIVAIRLVARNKINYRCLIEQGLGFILASPCANSVWRDAAPLCPP